MMREKETFLLNSIVLIGDYLLYVYLIIPVGYFINYISPQGGEFAMLLLSNFFLYMFFLFTLFGEYNLLKQNIVKNSFQRSKIIFDIIVGNKNIFNKIYLYSIMSFIATFGFFLSENHNFLFVVFLFFSYFYFFYAIKRSEFSTFTIYLLLAAICIYFTWFYVLYASLFLYVLVVFAILRNLKYKESNNFDIR